MIIIFVTFLFSISLQINTNHYLNISNETAKILVDQRTTNLATIISITLVVVGFLINNLAIKSPETYKLLFNKSKLYTTIYLTLTTIGCFIILSTLRDTSLKSYNYSNSILVGTYLVISIIILIGYLFKTIIKFASEKEVYKMMHEGLILEAERLLIKNQIVEYSKEKINEIVNKYDVIDLTNNNIFINSNKNNKTNNYKIKNINIMFLLLYITLYKIKGKKLTIDNLELDSIVSSNDNIIIIEDKKETIFDKIMKVLIIRKKKESIINEDDDTFTSNFKNKIEEYSKEGKHKQLEKILNSYMEVYKIEMSNN